MFAMTAKISIAIPGYLCHAADMQSDGTVELVRRPKLFRLPKELADQLAAESNRTARPEVRIVERALEQFLSLPADDRDRSPAISPAEAAA